MKKSLFLPLLLCSIFSFAQESIIGFSKESAEKQIELESKFEAKLKTTNLDEWMQKLAARPHWVGTEFGKENVDWIADQNQRISDTFPVSESQTFRNDCSRSL